MKKITSVFTVKVSDVDESVPKYLNKLQIPMYLSFLKAMTIKNDYPDFTVIGADTLAYINNEPVGKPKDKAEAKRFLESISGGTHKTITGVSVCFDDEIIGFLDTAYLDFIVIEKDVMKKYINTNIPYNKAGGIAVEEVGEFNFIKNIRGSFSSIMGLPVTRLKILLKNNNLL